MMRWKGWILVLAAGALFGCSEGGADRGDADSTIAVIPKGTTHIFWRQVESGARQAARDLNVRMEWKGPLKENDRAMQIALVEQFVSEGVSGIVLAPLDDSALLRPVRAAAARGIPVVIFDSDLKGEVGKDFVSFVATDNLRGGELAGEEMVRRLNGKGKVVLLRYQVGSASTANREQGFLNVIERHPEVELISSNQYAGATAGEAIQKSEEMLDVIRQADGVFCPNESSTYGMMVTLRKHALADRVQFIGFDASPDLVRALRQGEIRALVVQNPKGMAYAALETLVRHQRGEETPARIDTGVHLLTAENVDDPEFSDLLGE